MYFNVQKNTHSANVVCINACELHFNHQKQKKLISWKSWESDMPAQKKKKKGTKIIISVRTSYDSVPPVEYGNNI